MTDQRFAERWRARPHRNRFGIRLMLIALLALPVWLFAGFVVTFRLSLDGEPIPHPELVVGWILGATIVATFLTGLVLVLAARLHPPPSGAEADRGSADRPDAASNRS